MSISINSHKKLSNLITEYFLKLKRPSTNEKVGRGNIKRITPNKTHNLRLTCITVLELCLNKLYHPVIQSRIIIKRM